MIGVQYYLNRKDSLDNKISDLLESFEKKYKTKPEKILVNPELLSEEIVLFDLLVEPSQILMPNYFWFIFPDDYAFADQENK